MKHFITTSLLLICSFTIWAQQSGTIKYMHTVKLDINVPDGMDLGDLMPSEMATKKELIFNKNVSVFQDSKDNVSEDIEMSSEDGSFKMIIEQNETEEILYSDINSKESVHQTGFMGKEFLIEESIERQKRKIKDENITYLGYV